MTTKLSALTTAPSDRSVEEAIRTYCAALFSGGAAALSTLLNRTITIDVDSTLLDQSAALAERLPPPWVIAELRFTRGLGGGHTLILTRADAAVMAQLALGEDPDESAAFSPEHEDALQEMLNQMMNSASSSLKGLLDRPVTFGAADLKFIEPGDSWAPQMHSAFLARMSVDGIRRATLAITVPATVADALTARPAPAAREPETEALAAGGPASSLDLILDITLPITVELGRTKMLIRDILALSPGSVLELDKLAGEPVEILVNDRPIARGEVVIIDENFGVRLTHISRPADRIRSLR